MSVKEIVCVKNKLKTLYSFDGFMNINSIMKFLKIKGVTESVWVEYIFIHDANEVVYELYLVDEKLHIIGALFPYASYQNKTILS